MRHRKVPVRTYCAVPSRLANRLAAARVAVHDRPPIHPPPRAFGLFAAGGGGAGQGAGEAVRRGGHASGGADRYRQPLRRARVLRNHGQGRHPADHGLPARAGARGAGASRGPRAGGASGGAARPGRGGLRQPDEAELDQLPRLRRGAAARDDAGAGGACRGADLPDRRRRGAARPAHPGQPAGQGAGAGGTAGVDVPRAGSTSRSSAIPRTARRARPRAGDRARPGRDRPCARPAACRHQRRAFPEPRDA